MIQGWIYKLSSGLTGRKPGMPASVPCQGREGVRALFSSGLNNIFSCLGAASAHLSGLAILAHLLAPSAALSLPLAQGDKIINSAQLLSAGMIPATSSVAVTVVIRTSSVIELLTYAPLLPGAETVNVATTSYRSGSAATDPFINMPAPIPVGSVTPIDLTRPVPLAAARQLHQGEPLFIRLTDRDQNLDPLLTETVLVTVSNPASGDTEVLRLTETGPNSGVFVGYLPTSGAAASGYNGSMSVSEGNLLTIHYVDSADGTDSYASAVMVDPYGIFVDTVTGLPVNGATITMIDVATGLSAKVWGDDGVSSYPATLVSGGSANDSSGKSYSFPPGGYRYPFVNAGTYRFDIKPPPGYSSPSTVATPVIQTLPGAPYAIVNGSRNEVFVINPGPALRIDVPIDPAPASLWVQKSAGKDTVAVGEFVPYRITITNSSKSVSTGTVQLSDTLPAGFRFRKGSLLINDALAPDPAVSANGRSLTLSIGTVGAAAVATFDYVAEITAGAHIGVAVNTAVATYSGVRSNIASASVNVRDDLLRSSSILMGRVSTGACSEETGDGNKGVKGARIYLEDGSFVISDSQGLFHFEGVRPGLHVVQLDLDSLPDGYEAFACTENSRFAGRAFSQFVETQGGTLWRTDFHIRSKLQPAVESAVAQKQAAPVTPVPVQIKSEAVIELANAIEGKNIAYRVNVRGKALPQQATHVKVVLPERVLYQIGSSRMDGAPIADPARQDNNVLVYQLEALPDNWSHEFTFRGGPSPEIASSTLNTMAYLVVANAKGATVLTPPAETILKLDKNVEFQRMPDIVLHPHFPSFGDELDDEDRQQLDELARLLIGLRTEKIHFTGHTDNVRIAPRSRNIHADNLALSKARAKRVGRYLMDKLHLPPEKLTLDGKGESEPVVDNNSETGRARNRRVEVNITSSRIISRQQMTVLKAFSGEQRAETSDLKPVLESVPDDKAKILAPADVTAPEETAPVVEAPPERTAGTARERRSAAVISESAPVPYLSPAIVMDRDGILFPADGDVLLHKINSVQVCLDSKLTPRLLIDDKEVPSNRIGFTMKSDKLGKTTYSYIGVDFGDRGEHVVQFQGTDPFGNARFKQSINVKRSGEVVSIKLISVEGNVADGKTPIKLKLELYDNNGTRIPAGADLEIREGTLRSLEKRDVFSVAPAAGSFERVQMSKEGEVLFHPVNNSGLYRVVLGYGNVSVEAETYIKPKMRDWILVGLAEGTTGYNTASGNIQNLKADEVKENYYQDGRIAFYAKGQIKGEWLLTMSYDTAKSRSMTAGSLFQQIDPNSYYTLYGDSSQQQYDAASSRKLYVKVERDQFNAVFGDFDTGLSVTELSRYSRRMTGIKTEYQGKYLEATGFAAETTQVYLRDEIPGDGTSGLYRIKRRPLVVNSEKITIVTRDRFHSEVIVSSSTLSRFVDYAIDYDAGTIFFKQPVMSKDAYFNPITIVVEYEALADVNRDYTYGGRVGVRLLNKKLKIGATHIHEGLGEKKNNLFGVDTTLMITDTTKLHAEAAETKSENAGVMARGYAYLAELTHTSKKFDGKAYIREQQGAFGLGQQMGSESATRKVGLEGAYRLSDSFSSNVNLYRQTNLSVATERSVAEGKLSYSTRKFNTSLGLLHAQDRLADGRAMDSGQVTFGGKLLTLKDKLTLSVDHAQSVWGNSNVDFPTRTMFGAEYSINAKVTLLGAQEFTWGRVANTNTTRLGARSTPWKGAAITTTVERQLNENGSRLFGSMGLRQTWQLTDEWKIDAGLDRSQTIIKSPPYSLNPVVPAASGGSEDFTAVSAGASYFVKGLTWDSRFEFRTSASEDKWGVISGVVKEQGDGLALSARGQYFQTTSSNGLETRRAGLRLGLVHRPAQTRWIHLNRFDVIHENQSGGGQPETTSLRLVNNYTANYKPSKRLQVSLKYGAKFVMDTISGRRYQAYTDHMGFELRYDITKKWDVGLKGSVLHSWNGGQLAYSAGASTGYNVVNNSWVSLGYNVWGFSDKDFSAADYTARGPYVRFRVKFDQQTVKDAAGWLNK